MRSTVFHGLMLRCAVPCCVCAGVNSRVPTMHSVLLAAVVGPLGLLSHQLTKVSLTIYV